MDWQILLTASQAANDTVEMRVDKMLDDVADNGYGSVKGGIH